MTCSRTNGSNSKPDSLFRIAEVATCVTGVHLTKQESYH